LGFLPYNFFPSSIFMGDSGAYVIGLVLALLSIYSGSKIAVGALILGFAVIDMVWTILRRLVRRQSPFAPDRRHLHHQMVDSGLFSHRKAVLVLYLMAMVVAAAIFLAGAVAGFSILVLALITVMSILRILGPIQTRRL
jgi:UDP-GlcNAc:undecaprenyl-phosphate/decaprenyl-phosphate GlcNAc-1-phosphate transferase